MIPSMSWRRSVRRVFHKLGYHISHFDGVGGDPFRDMASFVHEEPPLIFDVGANVGQSIENFRSAFKKEIQIHAFEPSPTTFKQLKKNASQISNVHLWNCALGSSAQQLKLLENSKPEWSSFLPISAFARGSVVRETLVPMQTLDGFCQEHGISKIDILKTDTQGYELEVFKGAERTITEGRIGVLFCEVIFSDMYKGLPNFSQVFDFLTNHDFLLVSFYDIFHEKRLASWTDGLFVHKSYLE
jgi:FkbM family methyltransferase